MERNRLKTINVNVERPVVLFLNQDKVRADIEKRQDSAVHCSGLIYWM